MHYEGFVFFDGWVPTPRLQEYLLDVANYDQQVASDKGPDTLMELSVTSQELLEDILHGFTGEMQEFIDGKEIKWSAKYVTKGFKLEPHNDAALEDDSYRAGPGLICLWICPDSFEGREFIYGKVHELTAVPDISDIAGTYTTIGFNDPNLEYKGSVKPKTGAGVLVGRTNPIYWHGVTEMTTDSRIISLIGYM